MNSKPEKSTVLHNPPITVAASKMFTYPRRLANAWKPDIMEINLPESQLKRPDIVISIRQESTRTVPKSSSNIYQKIYRKWAAPMQIDGEYILDWSVRNRGQYSPHHDCRSPQTVSSAKNLRSTNTAFAIERQPHGEKRLQTAGLIHTLH